MKTQNLKIGALLALGVFTVITLITLLFSCTGDAAETEKNDLPIITDVTNNEITINSQREDAVFATASGLRSAVSVYSSFEKTTPGGSFWNPVPTTQTYYSTGSGVIYQLTDDGSGFILTNFHVIYDASANTKNHVSDKIYVYLYGMENEKYAIPATYVGGSANYDVAVLRVEKSSVLAQAVANGSVSAAKIGNSDALVPGDTTIAIGNPSATSLSGISATQGVVSVDSEYITMTSPDNSGSVAYRVIRTDTAVNSGNSGGGLYNSKGELIGLVNAKVTSSSVENIGYAIPSNVVRAIADNIIDYCYGKECESVMRVILGVTLEVDEMYTYYDTESGLLLKRETVMVSDVEADSSADGSFMVGDIIKSLSLNDKTIEITRRHHLIDSMLDARVGDTVKITVDRGGEEKILEFKLTDNMLAAY